MANTNPNADFVNLDFNSLKSSFISFLQNQDEYKDYDFTGSSLNVLLDVLSLNSYKQAFFINQLHSEAHLDSAQLYSSIISHAKDLNYTPRSVRSAKATVNVTFTATKESQPYIINKGSTFTTLVKNRSYVFSTAETISLAISGNDGIYSFNVDIYEGIYLKDSFIYQDTADVQRFKISNQNVDTDSITVVVYENGDVTGDNYNLSTTLLDLNQYSKTYFLQAAEDGTYEILFGDGVIGRKPAPGALIVIDYRVSNGIGGNGASAFTINFDPTADSASGTSEIIKAPKVITVVQASSGAPRESKESIRYYAPRHFQVQQRGVNSSDYEIMLKTQYPEINAVSAYGGEEVIPPRYGKVFVAIDLKDVDGLPESRIKEYKQFLKGRNVFGIDPIFVSPDFTYFRIDCLIRYNIVVTTSTPENIKTLVKDSIQTYNDNNLNDFGVTLRNSNLVAFIDDADPSIISNQTSISPFKKINPTLKTDEEVNLYYAFNFKNEFGVRGNSYAATEETCITSTDFILNGSRVSIQDDGQGKVNAVSLRGASYIKVAELGTVNYETGTIQLKNFNIDSYVGDAINIYVTPKDNDIKVTNKTVALIDPSEINLVVETLRQ